MPDRKERLRDVVSRLVDGSTRLGAAVITRDGLPFLALASRPVSDDTFSAMTAALLGAAEAALQEWSNDRPKTALIEGDQLRLEVATLDAEFLLAVVSPTGPEPSPGEVEKAAREMRAILKETAVAAR